MIVENGRRGYTGHCFRCKTNEFEPHGQFSIAQLHQRQAEMSLINTKEVRLPDDLSFDIPAEHMVWLYKAGIDAELAGHYRVGYSRKLDRIIVPVYSSGTLVAYTARSLYSKPKYIEKSVDGSQVFAADPKRRLPSMCSFSGPEIVLVEDNLSAIRVGRVARYVVSLMGTSLNSLQLARIFELGGLQRDRVENITVWLDGDGPGRSASKRICKSLRLLGYTVRETCTEQDPKRYSYREIQEILSD